MKALKRKNNAQLADLMNAMKKYGKKEHMKLLIDQLNNNEGLENLVDFLRRKNEDGKYQILLDHIDNQQKPDFYDAYEFLINNKKKLDHQPIVDEINGKESDFFDPIQGYI